MTTKKVRQRINPTFSQTFYFTDGPTRQQNIKPCLQQNCQKCDNYLNIIEHPITRTETQQQKLHKQNLRVENENLPEKKIIQTVTFMPKKVSTSRKEQQLKGQLEECGTYFFFRQPIHDKKDHEKLIPTDCKFNHTCHGRIGLMNQLCNYPNRNFDRLLKQKYDLKHFNNSYKESGLTYIFKQKIKSKK